MHHVDSVSHPADSFVTFVVLGDDFRLIDASSLFEPSLFNPSLLNDQFA
ncbi:hypothetical protein BH11PSE11_BH11PSE11_27500 [soil metagenome]